MSKFKKHEYDLYLISKIMTLIFFYAYISITFPTFTPWNTNFQADHMLAMLTHNSFYLYIIITIYNIIDYAQPHSSLNRNGLSRLKIFNGFIGILFGILTLINLINYMSLGLTPSRVFALLILIFLSILNIYLILAYIFTKQIFILNFKKALYLFQIVIIILAALYFLLLAYTIAYSLYYFITGTLVLFMCLVIYTLIIYTIVYVINLIYRKLTNKNKKSQSSIL